MTPEILDSIKKSINSLTSGNFRLFKQNEELYKELKIVQTTRNNFAENIFVQEFIVIRKRKVHGESHLQAIEVIIVNLSIKDANII